MMNHKHPFDKRIANTVLTTIDLIIDVSRGFDKGLYVT